LESLKRLEKALGYCFRNPAILDRALTHRSYTHEQADAGKAPSYEALEFLGDAILGFLIGEKLFLSDRNLNEGDLSKIRSYMVSARRLAQLSEGLGMGDYLLLSRGEEKTGGRRKSALLADLFESVVAAIYLDGGIDAARGFVSRQFEADFEKLFHGEIALRDFKSQLQEMLHRESRPAPTYQVISESGPDHEKEFVVVVSSEHRVLGRGSGRSKKEAEKSAAREAINRLNEEE